MRTKFIQSLIVGLAFLLAAQTTPATQPDLLEGLSPMQIAVAESTHIANIAEQVVPTVVAIFVESEEEAGMIEEILPFPFRMPERPEGSEPRRFRTRGVGAGVVIDGQEGWVMTNNHVVERGQSITIRYMEPDGEIAVFEGGDVRTDPKTEMAVVRIVNLNGKKLPEAKFGDSDAIRVGETVLAVGSPFSLHQSVSRGIVSAKGRTGPGSAVPGFERIMYRDFIQTDAAINRGNSGGPLVNIHGEVIGINTFIESTSMGSQGVGFAVPINLAGPVVRQLIREGRVVRGYLGIQMREVREERVSDPQGVEALGIQDMTGVLVIDVAANSPADLGGLEPGDVILSYDGKPIARSTQIQRFVQETPVGNRVEVRIFRPTEQQEQTLTLEIREQPEDFGTGYFAGISPERDTQPSTRSMGMTVRTLTESDIERLKLPENTKGVIVTRVAPNSEAEKEGIKEDTVITRVGRRDVSNLEEYKQAVEKAERDRVLLRVIIDGSPTHRALSNSEKK